MAPKGQKRTATDNKKAGVTKKVRTEVAECGTTEDPAMSAIVETIETDANLSQNCRNMLIAGIRASLNTPLDQRHEVQSKVVRMVEEVITAKQTSLQECLDKATATESKLDSLKIELTTRLSEAETDLAQKRTLVDEKTLANSSVQEKMSSAKGALVEKESAQKSGDLVMQEKQQNKALIEHTINTDLKAVIQGEDGSRSCNAILALISPLGFDESLIKALPGTCVKAPAERGSFDSMVLNQLETSLKETLAEFSKAVDTEAIAVKERSDAVVVATAAVEESVASQAKAEEEQSAAEAARLEASASNASIKAVLAAHSKNQFAASEACEGLALALEAFQNTAKGPFELLKNTICAAPAPAIQATSAPEMGLPISPQSKIVTAEPEPSAASPEVKATDPHAKAASPGVKANSADAIVDSGVVTAAGA